MASSDIISIFRGEDLDLNFTLDPAEDITGWTIVFTARTDSGVLTKPGTVVDGPNGKFDVTLDDVDTDGVKPGHYAYDVWRTDTGSERVLAIGTLKILAVIRDTA